MDKLHGPDDDPSQGSQDEQALGSQPQEEQASAAASVAVDSDCSTASGSQPVQRPSPVSGDQSLPPTASDDKSANGKHQSAGNNRQQGGGGGKNNRYEPRQARSQRVYGALDLGTNNCRLLIAHPTRRSFRVIGAFSRIIRLGEGISVNGALSDAAMERTIEALKICSEKMLHHNVSRSRLIATEACRVAKNSDEFIARVRQETGLDLEVIDRETEARLAVSGCASLLDRGAGGAFVFDIGGGSSELIWLDLRNARGRWRRTIDDRIEAQKYIRAWTSLPIGVVTLAEKFGGRVVNGDVYEAMIDYVMDALRPFEEANNIAEAIQAEDAHMLGTSGTVTTVAGVHLGLSCYQRHRVDGLWMAADDVSAVSRELSLMSYDERVQQPCIGEERADLVLAGCAILEAMIRMWPCPRMRVADRGLREGLLAGLMVEDQGGRVTA